MSFARARRPLYHDTIANGEALYDLDLLTMRVETSFTGLIGNVTAAHIHCCTAAANTGTVGVATPTPTFPGFPSGVKSGSYDQTFDMTVASSYNAGYVTARAGNLTTAFNTVKASARHMPDGGSVVLLSSVAARAGLANHEAVAAAKG